MGNQLYNEASKIVAEQGEVQVDGPNGVAIALTPEAALETANRLNDGATVAAGQRAMNDAKNA